ncbi:sensor histidine kinase [Natrinema versiforme]|uniref:histidine kinase n=1 Tax=Natrinema versiforme JCM 10478 TaxID=1227496 RepID=L9XN16_9EURY|nr:HAMP domain-containing sensor histidine kinase [Natrinema versiforme]ELY63130.1 HTR-like protein [Natrinema versiforme JCM 10478]
MIVVTDHRDDARAVGSDTVAIDAVPEPVAGYETADGIPRIAATNDAFDATFDAVSSGTSIREWLLRCRAVDEATVADACSRLADGDAIDVEIGIHLATGTDAHRRPVRLRSVDGSSAGDTAAGADGGETVDGYVFVTELVPASADTVELDRVASVITHDLRNPLDVAKAHLRAAEETGDADHFEQVAAAHDRMERIIRDALALARGEHALEVTDGVAIDAVASDAWATVDTGAASLSVAEDLPRVDADPDRLQRLLENLFRNSVEHGSTSTDSHPRQGVTDPVRVRVERAGGGFAVADDGSGIPADERERVFEPGYSSTEAGDGTGLGLTIVERIARAHDWTVSVSEGSRGGAKFEFRPIHER